MAKEIPVIHQEAVLKHQITQMVTEFAIKNKLSLSISIAVETEVEESKTAVVKNIEIQSKINKQITTYEH